MSKEEKWVTEGRRIIQYGDLNAQGALFGGRLVEWIDEATAIYCVCQMNTKRVVTLRISELLFKKPVNLYDILEFRCRTVREGKTSLTVETQVQTLFGEKSDVVCTAELQFVAVNEQGQAVPWKH